MNKSIQGVTASQLAHGTPSDKKIILKSFYKDDKCNISPAKDGNGRYLGIQENIPEIKKLEMGYVPSIESRVKIYDGIEIDLNNKTWARDWEWMQHCIEIADDFATGQAAPGAYFYIFRPGLESAKKVSEVERRVKLMNFVLNDSAENLYNRTSILGMDMTDSVISDVKDYLLSLVETEPDKLASVYESKTFTLELLLMHAIKKAVVVKRNGVFTFGEILLGVDEKAVVAFFANPKNRIAVNAIEAITYGAKKEANPLANEAVQGDELNVDEDAELDLIKENEKLQAQIKEMKAKAAEEALKDIDVKDVEIINGGGVQQGTNNSLDALNTGAKELSPAEKAAATRAKNANKKK